MGQTRKFHDISDILANPISHLFLPRRDGFLLGAGNEVQLSKWFLIFSHLIDFLRWLWCSGAKSKSRFIILCWLFVIIKEIYCAYSCRCPHSISHAFLLVFSLNTINNTITRFEKIFANLVELQSFSPAYVTVRSLTGIWIEKSSIFKSY